VVRFNIFFVVAYFLVHPLDVNSCKNEIQISKDASVATARYSDKCKCLAYGENR